MKIDVRKIVIGLFLSLCLGFTLFAGTEVQIPGTQQTIVVQLQNQNDSSLEKQIEFSLNNILPGVFKGVLEGASLAAGVTNGFGKLPEHEYKAAYPALTDGIINGFTDAVREDEEELCRRDEGYVPYLTEKGFENFSKYLVGLLLISQCGTDTTHEQRAAFLTQWMNSFCRGQEFTRGKILKFLLTLGTRGVSEGLSVNKDNQMSFSVADGLAGVAGGLIPELCVKFGLQQKNTRGRIATRVLSTAATVGLKAALHHYFDDQAKDFTFDLCKMNDVLMNTKVIGGVAVGSALTVLLVKSGLRPRDILDMVKIVKQLGPTIRTFVGF
jgi:hypothetical protein